MAQPIIIVGAARSGTKYLRDILATGANTASVPYDVNYIWRYRNADAPGDALSPDRATLPVRKFIRTQLFRLAGVREQDDVILFEKTVGTSLRVPFADRVFPDARFIHLIRDGRSVTESAMRQWEAPPEWSRLAEKLKGLPLRNLGYVAWFLGNFVKGKISGRGGGKIWGPRYPGVDQDVARGVDLATICARQWAASVRSATEALAALPADRVATIRYEDLIAGDTGIRRLCAFCGIADADRIAQVHSLKVDRSTGEKWRERMSDAQQHRMFEEIGPMLVALGYGSKEAVA